MKDKKQFFIPKNYEKKFSWIPGVSGWEQFIFLPVVGLDYLVLKHTGFNFSDKLIFCALTIAIPWVLLGNRPVRDNVPLYKHLLWKIKFFNRQRKFQYRKEGYHVENVEIKSKRKPAASESEGIKEAAASKEISSRLNSSKGNRRGILDHTGKPNRDVLEGVSNKS